MPDDFKIAPEPAILDGSLVDSAVYMRWETFLWHGPNATPRLVKKLNYCIVSGQTAARDQPSCKSTTTATGHTLDNSWVILTPATGD